MANDGKFLNWDATAKRIKQELGIAISAGAGDAGKLARLDATGRFDPSMMPSGVAAETKPIQATEAIAAGAWVNVYNSAGNLRVRNADATAAGKEANGFVLSAIANAATGTVYFDGNNTALSGLTVGDVLFLSTTPGVATAIPPSASGNVIQALGVALSTTESTFEADPPNSTVVLA